MQETSKIAEIHKIAQTSRIKIPIIAIAKIETKIPKIATKIFLIKNHKNAFSILDYFEKAFY